MKFKLEILKKNKWIRDELHVCFINSLLKKNKIIIELEKKVGFGMDQLLIRAALNAKFLPRLNKFGKALPTWDEIVVRLEIP